MTLDIRRLEGATIFTVCVGVVAWVALTGVISTSFELLRTSLLAGLFLLIRFLFMKNIPSPTGSGAIVMGIGIFINGAILQFSFLNKELAPSLTLILFLLLVFIAGSYGMDVVKGKLFQDAFCQSCRQFCGRYLDCRDLRLRYSALPEAAGLEAVGTAAGNRQHRPVVVFCLPRCSEISASFSQLNPGRKCTAFSCSRRSVRNRWLLSGRPPLVRAFSIDLLLPG